ncbi:aminoglycoside phosphotransferase family protein [Sulfurimonas autotrophica]|uniref:Aminoglycoside phosphotransferase n=1 Tax=Sulfurimonas autotrophica (strain ATCC BAA-671 / DSM 16294 / JCM 11897 / OK10) TaxID=563040 RepID=E0URH9_SULAO|nr:phosphotransferase [Sulfurimonas autotrophica]ADN10065.1 aminoglycoside phosphotransferase [Sulfurimonas autotrophica DSM 16294]
MQQIKAWLKQTPFKDYAISIASADASFRKYYRLKKENKSVILMDASLEKSSLAPFVDITQRLLHVNVKAPNILTRNLSLGYLILQDFGNTNLLDILNQKNFKELYEKAIDEILKMQKADAKNLPLYDKKFLHAEMDLMQEWFLEKKLGLHVTKEAKELLSSTLEAISEVVLSQPQNIFVHRDFHSRNIMLTPQNKLGIIDYQDAMSGALTYDLVSLLKDCYIAFEREDIEELVLLFAQKKGLHVKDEEFLKWFDFMGLQRHIKVLGIFSRLYLRDGKEGYLKDIPLTLRYVIETASRYNETKEFAEFLRQLKPKF